MFKLFKKKSKEVVSELNPMLEVEHICDWLPANDGLELVCGLCGLRQWTKEGEKLSWDEQEKMRKSLR